MRGIDAKDMERNLSFVLKGRDALWAGSSPKECSRVFVVGGSRMVLSGTTLFLGEKKVEEGVIYLSRELSRVVATKQREVVVFDFSESIVRRIRTESPTARGEVWGEYLGILFSEGRLEVFKDGKYVSEKKDVKDFVLPDLVVGSDGLFMGSEGVKRLLRSACGDGVIAVTEKKLMLGGKEVENPLEAGDMEYDRGIGACYYHCNFHGVNLLASSNSSVFLLLGEALQEVELDEEIKLLALRSDEKFNPRYLTGMDYSVGSVYLIDEDGVLSRFEAQGIGCDTEAERDVEFREKRYSISREEGMREIDEDCQDTSMGGDVPEEKKGMASMGGLLTSAKEDVSMEASRDVPRAAGSLRGMKSTGDPRVDALLEGIESQIDAVIKDFQGIRVEKRVFRMYKYNANDLSLFVEQAYKNIMRLEGYRSIGNEMAEQLSLMAGSLEVYKGVDEESIRSAVRYIDRAIEAISSRRRRRIVHYTKPLFYGIEKAKGIKHGLDRGSVGPQRTLTDVEYIERKVERDVLGDGFTHHFTVGQGPLDMQVGRTKESPKPEKQEAVEEKVGNANDTSDGNTSTMAGLAPAEVLQHHPPSTSNPPQPTNIFGQPISQDGPAQFGALFSNATSSNIFQSIASSPLTVPQGLPEKKPEAEQSAPNAFSRFASSRNHLFK